MGEEGINVSTKLCYLDQCQMNAEQEKQGSKSPPKGAEGMRR